jgi:apolipoprotein N-acyltransferase
MQVIGCLVYRGWPSRQQFCRLAPLVALGAGMALPLAFSPFNWIWVAVLSPAVLFALAAVLPRQVALWSAFFYGLGSFGIGVSWVYVSISHYGNGPFVALMVTGALIALLALFPWGAVYAVRTLCPQMNAKALWLGLPAAWVLSEWGRTWLFTGFPWLFLGYSQTDAVLSSVAPVFGVLGVSFVLAMLAGGLAWMLVSPRAGRVFRVGIACLGLFTVAYLLDRNWTRPLGQPLSVALLQGNITQDKKWRSDYQTVTLERYRTLTSQNWQADIIVWPETAIPMWYGNAAEYLAELKTTAEEAKTAIVLGVPLREGESSYNAVVSLVEPQRFYYKRHLVPFGEYIPLRNLLGPVLDILGAPMANFEAGNEVRLLTAAELPVGAFICYEAAYGATIAKFLPEARLLINISNDAWFGTSIGPLQHFQIARMRAIETERPLLRATNTGVTAVIDHQGNVMERAPQFEMAAITTEVMPREGATPYVRWRDWPVLSASIGILLWLALFRICQRPVATSQA